MKFNATGGDDQDGGNWGLGTQRRPQAFDENYIKVKGHVLGPQTEKIWNWFNEYKMSLEDPYKLDEDDVEIYFNFNLKV